MAGSNYPNTKQAKIETLWARGLAAHAIVLQTGFALEYVQHCIRLIQAHARSIRPESQDSDDTKHLSLILAKHGAGFPYFARVPI